MADKSLLPCPFCGPGQSVVSLWFDDVSKRWRVGCGRCGCSTGISPRDKTEAPAIAHWNMRGEWLPIETYTPSDDLHEVLVAHDGVVSEAYYNGDSDSWWLANTSEHDFDPARAIYPTHWREKPAPPTQDETP